MHSVAVGRERHYRPEIDGLRAIAVLPVVFFHAGFGPFGGGFVGVDIFFVISGYLITSIIVREMEAGTFSLRNFYERRARRILPALTLVVGACIPFAWIWLLPGDMEDFLGSILAICFFVSNVFFWSESDYFDEVTDTEPLLHTWSLAVEEQFYLLFPLFLLFFWAKGRGRIAAVLLAIFIASLGLAHWGAYEIPKATFFLLPARAWELALGALLALHLRDRDAASADIPVCQGLSFAGLALIALAVFLFDETTPFPSLYALAPTVGAALIIAFATPATLVGAALASRPLVGIGLISYSAYLWHQPIFAFTRYGSIEEPSDATMLLLSAASLLLAYLTWRFVEKPFRRPTRVSWRALVTSAGVTGAAFLAFSLAGYATDSFNAIRFTKAQQELLETVAVSPKRKECHRSDRDREPPDKACAYHYPHPDWVVLGNSHGVELAYELAENLRASGEGVKQLTISSCYPDLVSEDGRELDCARWTDEAIDYILREKELENVVLSYRTTEDLASSASSIEEAPAGQAEIAESYLAVLRRLAVAGKRVFLVLQAPILEKHVEYYVRAVDADDGLDFVAGVDRQRWDRTMAPLRDHLDELPKGVAVVDPAALFCNKAACPSILHGKALYFDEDHMSLAGADIVADEIIRRAPRLASLTGQRR